MTDLYTRYGDIASCSLIKQNHLGKCSNGKLRISTFVNDGTLRSIAHFASTLSNVKMLIISKFFMPFCLISEIIHPGNQYSTTRSGVKYHITEGEYFDIKKRHRIFVLLFATNTKQDLGRYRLTKTQQVSVKTQVSFCKIWTTTY